MLAVQWEKGGSSQHSDHFIKAIALHVFIRDFLKMPMIAFAEIEKSILKVMWTLKEPKIAKTILKNANKGKTLTLPEFKTYLKATVIETVCYTVKTNRKMTKLFLARVPRSLHKERMIFNKWCWGNWISTCKRMTLCLILHQIQKLTQNRPKP
jgi:hypothetical protein